MRPSTCLSAASGLVTLTVVAALPSLGCSQRDLHVSREDQFGRTYYIDGAGNWGFGVAEVRSGLRRANYQGNIINYTWSPFLNPALDQTLGRGAARAKGVELGRQINAYLQKYPQAAVNIIALSAGTGVCVWACESLEPPAQVRNVILLGSSLSSNYDMGAALKNISGGVYVYYSSQDGILDGPVRALGTIDGRMDSPSAGLVGLHPPGGTAGKIFNIGWSPKYETYGWTGAHTDATSEPFVTHVLARHIVPAAPDKRAVIIGQASLRRPAAALWNQARFLPAQELSPQAVIPAHPPPPVPSFASTFGRRESDFLGVNPLHHLAKSTAN